LYIRKKYIYIRKLILFEGGNVDMEVTINNVPYRVLVGHMVAEFRNSAGESRKEVRVTNLETLEVTTYTTYERVVTEKEVTEFLEIRIHCPA
jgi:hypothetical protein